MQNRDEKTEQAENSQDSVAVLKKTNVLDWRIKPRSYEFLGTDFHPLDPVQTLSRAKWMTTDEPFRYIVTPNVDHIVRLAKEPEVYGPLYRGAWLSVCDSRILELLAGWSNIPLKAVPGSDFTQQLFDNVITPDDAITVIGADPEIIDTIKSKYDLDKVNHHEPPMGLRHKPDAVRKCAEFIRNNPARYVFICVGSPQQEMIAQAAIDLDQTVGLGLCVGASLDFLAGKTKRAPKWMQKIRMEWLFRLLSEPRRLWKRYLIDGPRIFLIWRRWASAQK